MSIEGLAFGGEGIARRDGKVCFVPFTAPGDLAEVRITESKRKFDRGELVQLLEPGASRVVPSCPYFASCGGCSWQHVDYPVQLEAKRSHLEHLLRRQAGLEVQLSVPVPSPAPYHWRRIARLHVSSTGEIGFHKPRSNEIVPITHCPVLEESLNDELRRVREELAHMDCALPQEVELSRLPGAGARHLYLGRRSPGPETGHSSDSIGFLQAHEGINEVIRDDIRQLVRKALGEPEADLKHSATPLLLDLFCGDGNLSTPLAELGFRVEGHDSSEASIRRAQSHCEEAGLESCSYQISRFPEILKRLETRGDEFSLALIDPPRSGLFGYEAELSKIGIPYLIYVSCMPSVLARDLKGLNREGGYQVEEIQLYDMFPHTSHVESVVFLVRKERQG